MFRSRLPRTFWGTLGCALVVTPILPGQIQKSAPSPPTISSRSAIPALARGLVEDSRRLGEVVRLKMGNLPQGQQIKVRVNTLLGAAEQLDREIKLRNPNLLRRQQAVRNLRQAYQPVFEFFTQPKLNAPGSQRITERIGLNLSSLEDAMGIPRKPPVPETPLEVRLQRALIREYSGLIADTDTFMAGLNDRVPEGPQIRIEALALRDAVRKLRRFTAQGAPDRRIIQELASRHHGSAHRASPRGSCQPRPGARTQCASPATYRRGSGTHPERAGSRFPRFASTSPLRRWPSLSHHGSALARVLLLLLPVSLEYTPGGDFPAAAG